MLVQFPVFFEVVGCQEVEIPDEDIEDTDDETIRMESIKQWIDDNWSDIPLPEFEYCSPITDGCEFDWNCDVEVIG